MYVNAVCYWSLGVNNNPSLCVLLLCRWKPHPNLSSLWPVLSPWPAPACRLEECSPGTLDRVTVCHPAASQHLCPGQHTSKVRTYGNNRIVMLYSVNLQVLNLLLRYLLVLWKLRELSGASGEKILEFKRFPKYWRSNSTLVFFHFPKQRSIVIINHFNVKV